MAQYREGSVNLFFGETAVSGTGTRWLTNVTTGDMLLIGSNGPAAFVASVLSDTELLLEQGWPGSDAAGAVYAIHRDFDPTTGAPLMAAGDTALHIIFNRAVSRLSAQTAVAIAGSEAAQQAAAARTGAEAAAAIAVTASDEANDAKAAAQTAAQTASSDASAASAAAATAAADATSASNDAAAAAVSATTAGTAATAAGAAKDIAVASSGTATAAAGAAGTSAAAAAASADQAQNAAATATQAASDTDGARDAAVAAATATAQDATAAAAAAVTAGSAKDDAVTAAAAAQSDAADALAARNLAQAWAVSAENTPVPQYPGLYSARHWAKKAADSAAEAAGIVTGNNFGVIGDGGGAQFNAGGPGATLNFVAGAGVQLGFNAGARAVSIGTTDTAVTPGSYGSATQTPTFTVDAKGRLTAAGHVTVTPVWSSISAKPTTLSGYGITDAMPTTGGTFTGNVKVSGANPYFILEDSDYTDTNGLYALRTNSNNFMILKNTAAGRDFSTSSVILLHNPATGSWSVGAGQFSVGSLAVSAATGTAPLTIASTTRVDNLNADLLDGLHSATDATASTVAARDNNGMLKATRYRTDPQAAVPGVGTVTLTVSTGVLEFSEAQSLEPGDDIIGYRVSTNTYTLIRIVGGAGTTYYRNSLSGANSTVIAFDSFTIIKPSLALEGQNFGVTSGAGAGPRLMYDPALSNLMIGGANARSNFLSHTGLACYGSDDGTLSPIVTLSAANSTAPSAAPRLGMSRHRGSVSSPSAVLGDDTVGFVHMSGAIPVGTGLGFVDFLKIQTNVAYDAATTKYGSSVFFIGLDGQQANQFFLQSYAGHVYLNAGKDWNGNPAVFQFGAYLPGGLGTLARLDHGSTYFKTKSFSVASRDAAESTFFKVSHHGAAGTHAQITLSSGRGTHDAGLYPQAADTLGQIEFSGYAENAGYELRGASIQAIAAANWSPTVRTTDLSFSTVNGTTTTEHLRIRGDGTLAVAANAAKIFNPNGHLTPRPYTVSALSGVTPTDAGEIVYVTDATGGAVPAFWNGANWARVSDMSDATSAPAPGGGGGGIELVWAYTIPDATTVTEVVFDQLETTPGVYIIEFERAEGSGNLGLAMEYYCDGSWGGGSYNYESTARGIGSVEPDHFSGGLDQSYIKLNPDDPFGDYDGWPLSGSIKFAVTSEAEKHGHFPSSWEVFYNGGARATGFGGNGGLPGYANINKIRLRNHRTSGVLSAGTFRLYRKQTLL